MTCDGHVSDWRPRIAGSYVETYLLEKSRVVTQDRGERNYHSFYVVFRGLPEKLRKVGTEPVRVAGGASSSTSAKPDH